MSETILLPAQAVAPETPGERRTFLAGVFLMSLGSLLLELSLTRLFSVLFFYHFAFMAISIALLGLGAGGVFAYLKREWLARWGTPGLGSMIAGANAVLMLVVLEVDLHVPIQLHLSRANFLRLSVVYVVSALPFFLTGLFFSTLFARHAARVTQLYAADLAGGALACLLVVPVLNFVGGPNAVMAAALAMGLAAVVWAPRPRARRGAVALALAIAALIALNHSGRWVDIVYAKGARRDQPWVEFARWNAISRVEVDDQDGAKVIVIDADASTYIMNTDPHNWGPQWKRDLMSAAPSVANVLRPRGDYAIIGPGGGVDVLRAVAHGSPRVTGIEINPIIVNDIMRGRYAGYAHHLYDLPEVTIHVGDGRSWIRKTSQQFDVLQMTLVDTWASTAAGAFALSENNLYTVEAFREYFDHLRPDGFIAITRWEFREPREALRVVSVAMEALRAGGASADLRRHFIVISDGELDLDGRPVTVLAKKTPFSPQEEAALREHLAAFPNLVTLYAPYAATDNPFSALIAGNDPYGFARSYAYDVSPVRDDSPFFFFNIRSGGMLRNMFVSGKGMDFKVNLGVTVLAIVLLMALACVLAFLVLPLAIRGGTRAASSTRLLYFIAIGLGYILVEIAFIQRFVLFLGHPIYALTVVVFLMLLSSGAGSLLSRRMSDPLRVWVPLLAVVAVLVAYVWLLPQLLPRLVGLAFSVKLLVSGLLLVPLGFAMGMPFPSGLRALARDSVAVSTGNTVEWAWAMNAAASVLGSALAMVLAIRFGLNVTLACGAAAYLLATALTRRLLPA